MVFAGLEKQGKPKISKEIFSKIIFQPQLGYEKLTCRVIGSMNNNNSSPFALHIFE